MGASCSAEPPSLPADSVATLHQGLSTTLTDCTVASLVKAIDDSNTAGAGPHTITLMDGCTYTFTAANNYWYGPNALPAVTSDLTIEGKGRSVIERSSADSTPAFRLFFVNGAPNTNVLPNAGKLTLKNLTLRNGLARGGSSGGGGGGGLGLGGGLFSLNANSTLIHSTLAGNTVQNGTGAAAVADNGSAAYVLSYGKDTTGTANSTSVLNLRSSILADDSFGTTGTAKALVTDQKLGGVATTSLSTPVVIESKSELNGTLSGNPQLVLALDPKLDMLRDNGGPTQTLSLQQGSPADDAADLAVCKAMPVGGFDQRGKQRGGTTCDLGSFELQNPTTDLAVSLQPSQGDSLQRHQLQITVQNRSQEGSGPTLLTIEVQGATVSRLEGAGWLCTVERGARVCSHPGLRPAEQLQLTLDLELPNGASSATATVTAQVSSQVPDAMPGDNTATTQLAGDSRMIRLSGGGFACSSLPGTASPMGLLSLLGLALLGLRRRRKS